VNEWDRSASDVWDQVSRRTSGVVAKTTESLGSSFSVAQRTAGQDSAMEKGDEVSFDFLTGSEGDFMSSVIGELADAIMG
jgi:hypothetical protein